MTVAAAQAPAGRHLAELAAGVPVAGRHVLDVGCGSGAFLARLSEAGACGHGLEVDPQTLAGAEAAGVSPGRLTLGDGRRLPFPEAAFDCVSFIFSFHHVPAEAQPCMLKEVERVLAPWGHLVVEPEPFGPMTEVIKPIDDETEVRTRSQAVLRSFSGTLRLAWESTYTVARRFASAAALISTVAEADRSRAARVTDPVVAAEVSRRFAREAERTGEAPSRSISRAGPFSLPGRTMVDCGAIARLAPTAGAVLRCAMRPPHLMMVGGYLIDQVLFGDKILCLTVVGFDPELMRLAVLSSPFMHAGMLVGCAFGVDCMRLPAFACRLLLQLGLMLAAMAAAAHLYPGSTVAGLLAMLFAMTALEAGRGLITNREDPLTPQLACITSRNVR